MIRLILRTIHIILLDLPYYWQRMMNYKIINNSFIVVTHDLQKCGGELLALNIVRKLTEFNIPVTAVSLRPGIMFHDFAKYAPINVVHGKKLSRFFSQAYKRGCRKCICNTVISGEIVDILKQNGFGTVTLIHEMEKGIKGHYFKKYKKVCEMIVNNSDTIIFPSNYVKSSFERCLDGKLSNCKIHDQGLYFPHDSYLSDEEFDDFLKQYGINRTDNVVINVAVGSYRKGFDLFLDVARKMENLDNRIKFIWVGGKAGTIYKKYVKKHGIKEFSNLILIDYIDDIEKLNSLNRFSKILFLSSREDPFPAVVLNSFSVGTPVIAFAKSGGFVDIVINDKTGYIVEPYNTDSIVDKIYELIFDNFKLSEMEKNCIQESKKHNFDDYCRFLIKLFEINDKRKKY